MLLVYRIAELEKKIKELNDQIRVFKNELSDKQKEFQQEKADLQSVIDQLKQGGDQVAAAVFSVNVLFCLFVHLQK